MNTLLRRWFLVTVLGIGLVGPWVPTIGGLTTPRAQALLLDLAEHQPEAVIRVIVQKSANASTQAEELVARLGGLVTRDLKIINGFVAEIPASAVHELARTSTITWLSLDAVVNDADEPVGYWQEDFAFGSVSAQEPTAWLNGANWPVGAWTEIGEADGPVAGDVAISSFFSGAYQGLRLQGAGRGLQGTADLSTLASAQLTLTFRRKDLTDTDWVSVQATADGGATWTELGRLTGPATDDTLQTVAFDLGAFIVPTFGLRLITADTFQPSARVYIDYARIDHSSLLQQPTDQIFEGAQTNLLYLPAALNDTAMATPDASAAAELEAAQYGFNWLYVYDTFDAAAFTNNAGNVTWETNWLEDDVAGTGATAGNVTVYAGELWLDDNPNTSTQPSLRREANLTGALEAYLSFDYRTTSGTDKDDRVIVEVSSNKGSTYTVLETFQNVSGASSGWREYNLTSKISSDTVVRFRVSSNYGSTNESFVIDNVQLRYTKVCPSCVDTSRLVGASIQSVGADRVWNEAPYRQGQGVTVAVVDSGIAWHNDLYWSQAGNYRIVGSVNFADEWSVDDLNGHGTHVAGTLGGDGYLSDGKYMGVAPQVNLVDVKVLNDFGLGYLSDVVAGLQWINDNKSVYNIRVVNLSLNSTIAEPYHQSALDAALEILWFNRLVVVVSSGNNGYINQGTLYPPANDPFVITVGATDDRGTAALSDDLLAGFSAYGTTAGVTKPEIVAPGRNLASTLASEDSNLARLFPGNKVADWAGYTYFRMSGTSVAAPMVSGAAALLLQDEPSLTPDQVKYRLMATSNKTWPGYSATSAGYLDVYAAVKGTTTQSANTGYQASQLLWGGPEPITWGSVNWNSVNWNSEYWEP